MKQESLWVNQSRFSRKTPQMADIDDLPKEVQDALKAAKADAAQNLLDKAVRTLALLQSKAGIGGLFLTRQPNGDVIVSTVSDRDGKSKGTYAYVHRSGKMDKPTG